MRRAGVGVGGRRRGKRGGCAGGGMVWSPLGLVNMGGAEPRFGSARVRSPGGEVRERDLFLHRSFFLFFHDLFM